MTGNSGKPVPKGLKPFKPGQSGNPSGRRRMTAEEFELVQACKVKAPEALQEIDRLMHHARTEKVRLAAAAFIIERSYGKALVRSEQPGSFLEQERTEILLAMCDELKRQMAEKAVQASGAVIEYSNR